MGVIGMDRSGHEYTQLGVRYDQKEYQHHRATEALGNILETEISWKYY